MAHAYTKCKALLSGHVEVVKLLLSHNADAMCKDKCGYTSLHAAAASGQLDVVKYLLKLGVEVKWFDHIMIINNFPCSLVGADVFFIL